MIRATNVDAGRITPENMALIDPSEVPEGRDATLKAGEIIVVRGGAYTCDSAIIPAEYEGATAGYDMIVRVQKAEPEFVAFTLLSGPVRDAQLKPCSLRAAHPHLNAEELGDCVLAVPPRGEQREIVSFLKRATSRLDTVSHSIKLQHIKLCDYRKALITAAVTGQVAIPEEAPWPFALRGCGTRLNRRSYSLRPTPAAKTARRCSLPPTANGNTSKTVIPTTCCSNSRSGRRRRNAPAHRVALEKVKAENDGFVRLNRKDLFHCQVAQTSIPRLSRALHALIVELQARG